MQNGGYNGRYYDRCTVVFFIGTEYYGKSLAAKFEGITVKSWQKKQSTFVCPRRLVYGLLCSGLMTVLMNTVPATLISAAPPGTPCSKPIKTNFLGIRVASQVATMAMSVVEVVETEPTIGECEVIDGDFVNSVPPCETTFSHGDTENTETATLVNNHLPNDRQESEPTVAAELVPIETDLLWESVNSVSSETVMVTATVMKQEPTPEMKSLPEPEPYPEPEPVSDIETTTSHLPHPEWEPLNPTAFVKVDIIIVESPLGMPVVEFSETDVAEFEKELRSLYARLQKVIAVSKTATAASRGRFGLRRTPQSQHETTDPATKNELMLLIAAHYYNAGKYDDAARMLKQLPEEWRKEFLRYVLRSSSTRLGALPYLERWVKTI